jgi:hypothetical protein
MADDKTPAAPKKSKAQRMLAKLFEGAHGYVPRKGTYSAMPWVLRRAIGLFPAPREWQLLTYLYLRAGPEALVWLGDKQIAVDLGVGYRKVGPHIRSLIAKGFLQSKEHDGQRYLLLVDPEHALRELAKKGAIPQAMWEPLAEDFETIGLEPLEPPILDPLDKLPKPKKATTEAAE